MVGEVFRDRREACETSTGQRKERLGTGNGRRQYGLQRTRNRAEQVDAGTQDHVQLVTARIILGDDPWRRIGNVGIRKVSSSHDCRDRLAEFIAFIQSGRGNQAVADVVEQLRRGLFSG